MLIDVSEFQKCNPCHIQIIKAIDSFEFCKMDYNCDGYVDYCLALNQRFSAKQ